MHRLSPRQVQTLGGLICGEDGTPFEYRRFVDIEAFVKFTAAQYGNPDTSGLSRWNFACAVIEGAQANDVEGASGLAREVEKIIEAMLDLREFSTEDKRDEALLRVNEALKGVPVAARIAGDGTVEVVSTKQTRSQRVLEEQIHSVFGHLVQAAELEASRTHYAKARRYLTAADADYENAAKEAVSALEALVAALTGENDYTRAVKKATDAGLIPRPIDDIAIKLFAYRGNEPGVAHGQADTPDVTQEEAELVFNLAGALGAYLASRLRSD